MSSPPPRILVVSPSLPGLHSRDGAGHAALHLTHRLTAEGAACTLLVPRQSDDDEPTTEAWARFAGSGIDLRIIALHDGADAMLGWRCVEWLRERPAPDMVVVVDRRGIGATLLTARQAGLVLAGVPIITLVTGPQDWSAGPDRPATIWSRLRSHLEHEAIGGADARLFLHPRLREWWGARDARPEMVCGTLGAGLADAALPAEHILPVPPHDADALARIAAWRAANPGPPLRIAIPRNSDMPGRDPVIALVEALEGAAAGIRLGLPPEPAGATRILPADSVILLADAADLSDPLAQDALAAGLPVLAPGADGALACDADGALAPGADGALACGADGALAPLAPAPPAAALLPFLRAVPPPPPPPGITGTPLVSVCISHFDRPALLAQTLDSLRAQTWPHVEVVLVDDASPSRATRDFLDAQEADFAARGWRIIRNGRELWQSASRNLAAQAARGEFILIMDDDNLARPEEIEVMLRALHGTGADAVAALQDLFTSEHNPLTDRDPMLERVEFFPSGGPADAGIAANVFGDVNVLFRREAFMALGGYTDEPELGCEDYELGAALVASGRRLVVIPRALYLYRYSSVNMAKGMSNERLYWSHRRPLRPPLAGLDGACRRVLALVHGAEHAMLQDGGWSYWKGRPVSAGIPEEEVEDPSLPGTDFQYYAAMLALRAGDPGPALRMLRPGADPRAARLLLRAQARQAGGA